MFVLANVSFILYYSLLTTCLYVLPLLQVGGESKTQPLKVSPKAIYLTTLLVAIYILHLLLNGLVSDCFA